MKTTDRISVRRFLHLFESFSQRQQLKIAEVIRKKTLTEKWSELKKSLPNLDFSENEIMDVVKAVRNRRYSRNR